VIIKQTHTLIQTLHKQTNSRSIVCKLSSNVAIGLAREYFYKKFSIQHQP
jgi:hypothetical protein